MRACATRRSRSTAPCCAANALQQSRAPCPKLSPPAFTRPRTKVSTDAIYPVLITRDAATTIEQTLRSLAAFPEVIVYDNGSTDDTVERCRQFPNVKVAQGEFFGYGPTKNHAVSLAGGDWVLSI